MFDIVLVWPNDPLIVSELHMDESGAQKCLTISIYFRDSKTAARHGRLAMKILIVCGDTLGPKV